MNEDDSLKKADLKDSVAPTPQRQPFGNVAKVVSVVVGGVLLLISLGFVTSQARELEGVINFLVGIFLFLLSLPFLLAGKIWSQGIPTWLKIAIAILVVCILLRILGETDIGRGSFTYEPTVPACARAGSDLPRGIAVNADEAVFVADSGQHIISKISSRGVVGTLAGMTDCAGHDDGAEATARFNGPFGVAVDASGNIYVADTNNHSIRKITPKGTVSTLAGVAGESGNADGAVSQARFNAPRGIATDSSGNIYVADTENHTIRKITSNGIVSTLAGVADESGSTDGTGRNARFNTPRGIATDSIGSIYVADTMNQTIRKITSNGIVSTVAGLAGVDGHVDGSGPAARFSSPSAIALDHLGNMYVADTMNDMARKITPQGMVTSIPNTFEKSTYPQGISVDKSNHLYVAYTGTNDVRIIDPKGTIRIRPLKRE